MEFREKFISYLDILGFSSMVKKAEMGERPTLPAILELLKCFGSPLDRETFEKDGPFDCPESKYQQKDLDFCLIQISDCVIISTEISPAGAINLLGYCHTIVLRLLKSKVLCRGYIIRGNIYHTASQIIGSGYLEAHSKEAQVKAFGGVEGETGTPFVEIDRKVVNYISNCGDQCVEKMYKRLTRDDGETAALFPFQRLPPYGLQATRDQQKQQNQNSRQMLEQLKQGLNEFSSPRNQREMKKHQFYHNALDDQIRVCNQLDDLLDSSSS